MTPAPAQLGAALDYDTRDIPLDPPARSYATLRIGFSTPDLGSDVSFRNLKASFARYSSFRLDLVAVALADKFASLRSIRQLSSSGFGVRCLAHPTYKVNVSAALAFTRNDAAVYFHIGEAF